MANQSIGDLMEASIGKIRDMVDANTVVGDPITTPDGVTVIPVSRMSFGFASGGNDKSPQSKGIWGGAGAAVRVSPIGFLVVKDGGVHMVNLSAPAVTPMDRLLDMIPEIIDRVEYMVDKYSGGGTESAD